MRADAAREALERELAHAIETGTTVDRRTGDINQDDPAIGGSWTAERAIPADLIYEALAGLGTFAGLRARAFRLRGARVTGQLDLEATELGCTVSFDHCWFDASIVLRHATTRAVRLTGSHAPAIDAAQLTSSADLDMSAGFTCHGQVVLSGAHVGYLDCRGGTFDNPGGDALNAATLTVDHVMFCSEGFTAHGAVNLTGGHVGYLDCRGGTFDNPGGDDALNAESLTVRRDMLCSEGFTANGGVRLIGGHVGMLDCRGGTFDNPGGDALVAAGLTVDQAMFCSDGFTAHGAVNLAASHVGYLDCAGGTFDNPGGDALNAASLTVNRDMFCSDGFTAGGRVLLRSAHVGGQLVCAGSTFDNPGGDALNAAGIAVGETMVLTRGFTTHGAVTLTGGHVGYLDCRGGTFESPGGDHALNAESLTVDRDMFCSEGFTAHGPVRLASAHVGGQLVCTGGTFDNPGGDALYAASLTVEQIMFCAEGFTAHGRVTLVGCEIGGDLDCQRGTFDNPRGMALDLERTSIKAALRLGGAKMPGVLDLTGARCAALMDDQSSWPRSLGLDGFSYEDIRGTDVDLQDRLRWIKLQPTFSPLPYAQLASTYRRHGHDGCARTVAITAERDRRTTLRGWRRIGSWLLDVTVGYGHRPWLAGVWLTLVILLGGALTNIVDRSHIERTGDAAGFNSLVYALDQSLPIVDLAQGKTYTPHGPAMAITVGMVLLGWALTSVFVLALTGVIKRD